MSKKRLKKSLYAPILIWALTNSTILLPATLYGLVHRLVSRPWQQQAELSNQSWGYHQQTLCRLLRILLHRGSYALRSLVWWFWALLRWICECLWGKSLRSRWVIWLNCWNQTRILCFEQRFVWIAEEVFPLMGLLFLSSGLCCWCSFIGRHMFFHWNLIAFFWEKLSFVLLWEDVVSLYCLTFLFCWIYIGDDETSLKTLFEILERERGSEWWDIGEDSQR